MDWTSCESKDVIYDVNVHLPIRNAINISAVILIVYSHYIFVVPPMEGIIISESYWV